MIAQIGIHHEATQKSELRQLTFDPVALIGLGATGLTTIKILPEAMCIVRLITRRNGVEVKQVLMYAQPYMVSSYSFGAEEGAELELTPAPKPAPPTETSSAKRERLVDSLVDAMRKMERSELDELYEFDAHDCGSILKTAIEKAREAWPDGYDDEPYDDGGAGES